MDYGYINICDDVIRIWNDFTWKLVVGRMFMNYMSEFPHLNIPQRTDMNIVQTH